MTTPQWRDVSTYDRSGKRVSETYKLRLGQLALSVVLGHTYYPNTWVMHCPPFYDTYALYGVTTATEAQSAALVLVREKIDEVCKALLELEGLAQP